MSTLTRIASGLLALSVPTLLAGWPALALAQGLGKVIYSADSRVRNTAEDFSLYLQGPLAIEGRPRLVKVPGGLTFSPGGGGFTLWKFAELTSADFDLEVVFTVPGGIRYSNSGIYFLYTDPTRAVPEELPPAVRNPFLAALEAARQRSQRYGSGPYEADFFAHELQIIAGFEQGLPPENHGPGAFYGVDPVATDSVPAGKQRLQPYDLFIGEEYELSVEARGTAITTYLRATRTQKERVEVSRFENVSRTVDPIRGGSPTALLLQGFPNNGGDVKAPVFRSVTLREYPATL